MIALFLLLSRIHFTYSCCSASHHFLHFLWQHKSYQWNVLPLWLAAAPRVFTSLTKPILFFCQCKGFHIITHLDDILVFIYSKDSAKRLVVLELHINFSKYELCLTLYYSFGGLCWDTVDMSVPLPSDKLLELHQLAHFCYRYNLIQSIRLCLSWEIPIFMPMDMHNFASYVMSFRVTC